MWIVLWGLELRLQLHTNQKQNGVRIKLPYQYRVKSTVQRNICGGQIVANNICARDQLSIQILQGVRSPVCNWTLYSYLHCNIPLCNLLDPFRYFSVVLVGLPQFWCGTKYQIFQREGQFCYGRIRHVSNVSGKDESAIGDRSIKGYWGNESKKSWAGHVWHVLLNHIYPFPLLQSYSPLFSVKILHKQLGHMYCGCRLLTQHLEAVAQQLRLWYSSRSLARKRMGFWAYISAQKELIRSRVVLTRYCNWWSVFVVVSVQERPYR